MILMFVFNAVHFIIILTYCVKPLQPVLMARLKNPYVYVATTDVIVLPEDYEIEFAKPIATKPSGSHNQFYYYSVQSTYPSKSNERIDSDVRKKQILISSKLKGKTIHVTRTVDSRIQDTSKKSVRYAYKIDTDTKHKYDKIGFEPWPALHVSNYDEITSSTEPLTSPNIVTTSRPTKTWRSYFPTRRSDVNDYSDILSLWTSTHREHRIQYHHNTRYPTPVTKSNEYNNLLINRPTISPRTNEKFHVATRKKSKYLENYRNIMDMPSVSMPHYSELELFNIRYSSDKTTRYKKPYSIDSAEDEVIRKSESKIHKKPSILEMDEYRSKDKVIYREPVAEIIYERRTHPTKQINKKQYLTKPKEYAIERQDFKTIYYYDPTRSTLGHSTEKVFGGLYFTDRIRGKFEEPATELVVEFRKTLPSEHISHKDNKYTVHKSREREKYTQSAKKSLSYRKTLSSKKYASKSDFEERKYGLFTSEMPRHKKPKNFKSNESRKFYSTERKHSVKNIPTELFSFHIDEHFENFYDTSSTKTYKITNYKHPYFIEMDEVRRVHSTNEPHHGAVYTTNIPHHKEVCTSNRPHHVEVYSTNRPHHGEIHSTNRPHHAEVQSTNRPPHGEVPLNDKPHYGGANHTNRPRPVSVHSSNRPYHGESFSNVRLHYEGGYSNDNISSNDPLKSSNDRPHHGKVYSNVRLHYEEGYPNDITTSSSDRSEHGEGYTNVRPHYEGGYYNDITSTNDRPEQEEVYSNLRPHYKGVYPIDITTSSSYRPFHEEVYSNLRPYYEGVYRNDITTTSSDRPDQGEGYSTVRPHYEGVYSSDIMTFPSDRPYHGEVHSNVRPHYEGGYSIDRPHHEGDYTTDRSHPEQVSDTQKPYPINMKEYDENLADIFKNYQPVTSADDPLHINLLNPTPTISGSNDSTFDSMYLMSVLGNKTDKCYTCGMDEVDYTSENCYLVFEHTDRTFKYKMRSYKSKCSGKTFIGGCFKRFLDIGHYYSERGCRQFPPAQGRSFASSRYASIERMLLRTDEGCTVSPAATLVPFSRSVLLYARFHVCVCTKNYCNNSSMLSGNLMFYFILIYFFLSNKCFIISII